MDDSPGVEIATLHDLQKSMQELEVHRPFAASAPQLRVGDRVTLDIDPSISWEIKRINDATIVPRPCVPGKTARRAITEMVRPRGTTE